jgi:predicted DNA-binding transcriptional regulator YafY
MDGQLKKTERLIKMWVLLHNNPHGYTIKELADRFEVNVRTIYRDIRVLEEDLKVPVFSDGKRWKLDVKRALPPVRFTVPEALNVFLSVRLMLGYNKRYDPNTDATFSKLGSILPQPLAEQVQKTVDWMQKLPKDERHTRVMTKLAEAWTSRRRVKISYWSLPSAKATGRIIEPYFIEPAAPGRSSYVVAFCHLARELRIFKIERIEAIELTDESYTIPQDFDANRYFSGAWGIVVEGEEQTVRLKFSPGIARLIEETIWHPSQKLARQADGSVIMTLKVFDTYELITWILGWGQKVEVLEPAGLRKELLETAEKMVKIYQKR